MLQYWQSIEFPEFGQQDINWGSAAIILPPLNSGFGIPGGQHIRTVAFFGPALQWTACC
jgi:hypothetical protein